MTKPRTLDEIADLMVLARATQGDESDLTAEALWPRIEGDAVILAEALERCGEQASMQSTKTAIARLLAAFRGEM